MWISDRNHSAKIYYSGNGTQTLAKRRTSDAKNSVAWSFKWCRKTIQLWQLYSVLGQDPIVGIVSNFYQLVFADEKWFRAVFARVGDVNHQIGTQASMWLNVMAGGPYYHGAEYRFNFHHTHMLMNEKGAKRWSKLMAQALEFSWDYMTDDPRVRLSINTFLHIFLLNMPMILISKITRYLVKLTPV